jgi:hypothetical protein
MLFIQRRETQREKSVEKPSSEVHRQPQQIVALLLDWSAEEKDVTLRRMDHVVPEVGSGIVGQCA